MIINLQTFASWLVFGFHSERWRLMRNVLMFQACVFAGSYTIIARLGPSPDTSCDWLRGQSTCPLSDWIKASIHELRVHTHHDTKYQQHKCTDTPDHYFLIRPFFSQRRRWLTTGSSVCLLSKSSHERDIVIQLPQINTDCWGSSKKSAVYPKTTAVGDFTVTSVQFRGNIISQNVTRCTMATVQRLTVIRPSYCFRQEWCPSSFIFFPVFHMEVWQQK